MPFAHGDLPSVIAEGYRLNNPLLIGGAAAFPSAFDIDGHAVIVETVKPAEDGNGVIVRLYESLGRSATTALSTSLPARHAVETDLLEAPVAPVDLSAIHLGPFEIKTILLED
jgi:alpha-mannosidase